MKQRSGQPNIGRGSEHRPVGDAARGSMSSL